VNLLQSQAREAPWQFDVLIVGSGYGASIMAARIAPRLRPGCRLAVLERGREWIPGTFPDRLPDVLEQSRLTLMGSRKGQVNNPTGLFNVQQYEEITVLSGNGLGGSSLINASVAIRADQEIFEQAVWPEALRNRQVLEPYYELAEYELGAAREPWNASHKMIAQRKAWESLVASGASYESANLTLTRSPSHELPVLNRQKIRQRGCIDCGDCFTGCNVGAKNSLAMNYLPLARQAGGEIYTHTEVHHIAKSVQGGYQVYFTHLQENGSGGFHNCHGVTTARVVILGAGSVGSSEILMRSRALGLSVSPRLGCNWTGNGDALGFIRKCQLPTGIGGYSAYPTDRVAVGPTIQSNLTYPHRPLAGRVLIQDGAIARAYATALGTLMRDVDLDQTQALLGMGHDGANGRMYLDEHGTAQITWPELTDGRYRTLIRGEFERIAAALGGEYAFLKVFGDRLISVHPLGGCGMADDPSYGVVNDRGQVYDADHGGDSDVRTGQARVHDGLYVVDGAMLPTSLGCNPLLTISALAERCADHLAIEPALGGLFRSS
jgi:cholesterol oxidase